MPNHGVAVTIPEPWASTLQSAREAGVAIPLGAMVAQLIGALRAQGDGDLDHSALLRGVERMSGRFTE